MAVALLIASFPGSELAHAQTEMAFRLEASEARPDVRRVIAAGMITPATPDRFRQFMARTTADHAEVHLHSAGGDLDSAMALGALFRRHGLTTAVGWGHRCLSACLLAYVGGVRRYVGGLHESRNWAHVPVIRPRQGAGLLGVWRELSDDGSSWVIREPVHDHAGIVGYLRRMGGGEALADLIAPRLRGDEANTVLLGFDRGQARDLGLIAGGPLLDTWMMRPIWPSLHVFSRQRQTGGQVAEISFHRDPAGTAWLRLWFETATESTRAPFQQMLAALRWIDAEPYARDWQLSSDWPSVFPSQLRVGRHGERDWIDIPTGGDLGWLPYATRLEVRLRISDQLRRVPFTTNLRFQIDGGVAAITRVLAATPSSS